MLIANKIISIENNNKIIKKSIKSKTWKLSKSQKLAKSKKSVKNGNLSNLNAKKDRLSFFTLKIKTTF